MVKLLIIVEKIVFMKQLTYNNKKFDTFCSFFTNNPIKNMKVTISISLPFSIIISTYIAIFC